MTRVELILASGRPAPADTKTIMELICEGKSPKQIGELCHLSNRTIEARLVVLRHKNHCNTIAQLVYKYTLFSCKITENFYL